MCSRHPEPGYCFLAKCVTEGYGEWKAKDPIVLPKSLRRMRMSQTL